MRDQVCNHAINLIPLNLINLKSATHLYCYFIKVLRWPKYRRTLNSLKKLFEIKAVCIKPYFWGFKAKNTLTM